MGRRRRGRRASKWAKHATPWQPSDIVLWRVSRQRNEVACHGCGLVIEIHDVYEHEGGAIRCRYCLGIDAHVYVPAGDGGMTRRVSTRALRRAVIVRRRGSNVYREGVLVEAEAVHEVASELRLDVEDIVAELVLSPKTARRRRRERAQRLLGRVGETPAVAAPPAKPRRPVEAVPPRRRTPKREAPVVQQRPEPPQSPPSAPEPPAIEPRELAQRLSEELPSARPRRCLEVARWAIEALEGEEIEQLRAHDIVMRWIRRSPPEDDGRDGTR